ncbi:MAG: ATP-binding cassette domain-containing protein [Agarilytica sp.]
MIKVHQLHKTFGKVVAVDDISFHAHRGEIYGLLGPNGAGKTTTLRCMYGVFTPDSGDVHIDDISVLKNTLQAQARLGVLPDGGSLYKRLTARENIRYFGELHKMKKSDIENSTEKLSSILGMENILDRRTMGFSQGERMKVNLARAIVHNPDYVLLDEPTNGLDVLTTKAVRKMLLELKAEGKCVIFSSHLMHEVNNLCDRVGIVNEGKIAAQGSIPSVIEASNTQSLEDAFVHFAYPELHNQTEHPTT